MQDTLSQKLDKSDSPLPIHLPIIKYPLDTKIKYLEEIRHEIKKKRLVFDENKEKFGLSDFYQLMKVKNTSEVKGYPFRGSKDKHEKSHGLRYGLKIVPIETKYEKLEHPSHLEYIILKELTDNIVKKNVSPHITHYLGVQKLSNKCRALKPLNLKRLEVEDKIRTHSIMLISEFVEGGSLDNWIFETYENDNNISDEQWKIIVFQLIYTIAIIQKYYKMMHNDFHYGNILIDNGIEQGGYFVYEINGKTFYIKNTGVIPKIWDFEFCMTYTDKISDSYPNKFIVGKYEYDKKNHKTLNAIRETDDDSDDFNVPFNYNEVYDLHYFLTSLLDLYISQELFDWILKIYPSEVIPEDENSSSSSSSYSDTLSSSNVSDNDSDSNDSDDSNSDNDDSDSDDSDSDDSDDSDSDDSDSNDSDSDDSDSSTSDTHYLKDGRLINGTEEKFNLVTPLEILNNPFFEQFLKKPDDFDENKAMYFKAGF
jgi:hypothetical protein